ncbi:MAG: signal recognition particle-docking protein FtsY [Gammaproteobacteria bacterium]|nr:signal recognition particle-docking protein FtsY [Gammaproteobacteria bacterium]
MFERLKQGILKTRESLARGLRSVLRGGAQLDSASLEEVEDILLAADVGVGATQAIIDRLKRSKPADGAAVLAAVKDEMYRILAPCEQAFPPAGQREKPYVLLVVGVNGVGKTTTIGKMAAHLRDQGLDVVLAAGDTFRAAAVEQLSRWGERLGIPVVAQHTGADSASVIFDAYSAARSRNAAFLLADTAGRLHTKDNLMQELSKIRRVLGKQRDSAPDEIMIVLDATTGQNAISQVRTFHAAVKLDSIVITKLDGTAKGGVVIALAEQFKLPIRFIGVGESAADLQPFNAREFVDALFSGSTLNEGETAA